MQQFCKVPIYQIQPAISPLNLVAAFRSEATCSSWSSTAFLNDVKFPLSAVISTSCRALMSSNECCSDILAALVSSSCDRSEATSTLNRACSCSDSFSIRSFSSRTYNTNNGHSRPTKNPQNTAFSASASIWVFCDINRFLDSSKAFRSFDHSVVWRSSSDFNSVLFLSNSELGTKAKKAC